MVYKKRMRGDPWKDLPPNQTKAISAPKAINPATIPTHLSTVILYLLVLRRFSLVYYTMGYDFFQDFICQIVEIFEFELYYRTK